MWRSERVGQILIGALGFLVFSSAALAHYAMLQFPQGTLDCVKVLGTIQNAWFTAAYFASACAVWSSFVEESHHNRMNMATSPLGIAYTIASRLEFSYPVIATYTWLFYKRNSRCMPYVCVGALLARFFFQGGKPWRNISILLLYASLACLHAYACFEAGNHAGVVGAVLMMFVFHSQLLRTPKVLLYFTDVFEPLLGMALVVICLGWSYSSMSADDPSVL